MNEELWKIVSVFILSAIKFGIGGVPAAIFAKFSFFKSVTITTIGGITGTVFFTYLSDWLIKGLKKVKDKKQKKAKRKFTKTNRVIVWTKMKLGLTGIAVITPLFLSIPLGCFIAMRYYENKQRVILYMSVSIFMYAVGLYFFYKYIYSSILSLLS
ncbi:MAG: hypothetical protein J0M08_10100 [Bacteroidetes bacterium]|nr:hypothetical protein [Bacteroidota bacterium]